MNLLKLPPVVIEKLKKDLEKALKALRCKQSLEQSLPVLEEGSAKQREVNMPIRVAINGFGRIGRLVLRAMLEREDTFKIVAVNDLASVDQLAYLLKYDSTQGTYPGVISVQDNEILIANQRIKTMSLKNPADLPWGENDIDVVIEATGLFRDVKTADKPGYDSHVDAGAKKVIITAPTKGPAEMVVLGVNDEVLKPDPIYISNASCTTNSLAPVVKILHKALHIERGLMVTVHAYTGEQMIVDAFHKSDLRRSRAGATNIIPTTTNAAAAIGKVIPELEGKLDGYALRVPVPAGSITDLTVNVRAKTDAEHVNKIIREAAESDAAMKGILEYISEPIVSSDIVGNPHSGIFDSLNTLVIDGTMVKCTMWYDNEWGYSCRTAELAKKIAKP